MAGDRGTLSGIPWRVFKKLPCRGSIFVQLLVWDSPSLPVAPHIPAIAPLSQERSHRLGEPHLTLAVLCCPPLLLHSQAGNWPREGAGERNATVKSRAPLLLQPSGRQVEPWQSPTLVAMVSTTFGSANTSWVPTHSQKDEKEKRACSSVSSSLACMGLWTPSLVPGMVMLACKPLHWGHRGRWTRSSRTHSALD